MATIARLLPHALSGYASPRNRWRRRLAIIADDLLSSDELSVLFPELEHAVLIRDAVPGRDASSDGRTPEVLRKPANAPHILSVYWDPHEIGGWSERNRRALRSAGSTLVCFKSHADVSGRLLRDLRRCGLRWCVFDENGRWRRVSIAAALLGKVRLTSAAIASVSAAAPLRRVAGVFDATLLRFVRSVAMERGEAARGSIGAEDLTRLETTLRGMAPPAQPARVQRVLHFVSSLDSGGAERQVCVISRALKQRGLHVLVRTQTPPAGEQSHYKPLLDSLNIQARQAGSVEIADVEALARRLGDDPIRCDALRFVPGAIRPGVLDILGELLLHEPDVLHCWLDEPSILGGMAGLIAGVPRIVLSTRNVNPTRFPHLCKPWMRECYRFLARQDRIVLAGNSRAGINDYARWMGVDAQRFVLLRNATAQDAFDQPAGEAVNHIRREWELGPTQPLIVGIMRLSIEKRPDVFVETIRRLRLSHPQCVALLAGVGPLLPALRRRLAALGMERVVHLLGQRTDVPELLAAADVVLLTSDHEGTPNCLLEAAALGKAIVATDAGGTGEVVTHESTGLLATCGDIEALSAAVSRLLNDAARRTAIGQAARESIRERFALGPVLEHTLAAYAPRGDH